MKADPFQNGVLNRLDGSVFPLRDSSLKNQGVSLMAKYAFSKNFPASVSEKDVREPRPPTDGFVLWRKWTRTTQTMTTTDCTDVTDGTFEASIIPSSFVIRSSAFSKQFPSRSPHNISPGDPAAAGPLESTTTRHGWPWEWSPQTTIKRTIRKQLKTTI